MPIITPPLPKAEEGLSHPSRAPPQLGVVLVLDLDLAVEHATAADGHVVDAPGASHKRHLGAGAAHALSKALLVAGVDVPRASDVLQEGYWRVVQALARAAHDEDLGVRAVEVRARVREVGDADRGATGGLGGGGSDEGAGCWGGGGGRGRGGRAWGLETDNARGWARCVD